MSREEFDTESGLISDYVGEVIDAWFAVDDKFGNTQLYLKQTTDQPSVPEITERFSVGGAWRSFDGGVTIENAENPDKTKIHESSRYGQLIRRVMDDLPQEAGDTIAARGNPRTAATWIGTRWRWGQVAKDYTMKQDDGTVTKGTSKYNMPVEFLGMAGEGAAPSSPTASTATSTLDGLGLSDEMVASLREVRAASATHGEFVDKAVGLTGVLGNDTLVKAIADESQLWKELA